MRTGAQAQVQITGSDPQGGKDDPVIMPCDNWPQNGNGNIFMRLAGTRCPDWETKQCVYGSHQIGALIALFAAESSPSDRIHQSSSIIIIIRNDKRSHQRLD